MPLYDFGCGCGAVFERFLTSWQEQDPPCPECGRASNRRPSRIALLGGARPPVGPDQAPRSWTGVRQGDREYITQWRRQLDERAKFEERNPEFATQREALAAHEGAFEKNPLTYRELAERATRSGDATQAAAEASAERRTTTAGSAQPDVED